MVTLEIVRGVFISGQVYAPGSRVEVAEYDAAHLISIGKAKKADPLPPPMQEEAVAEEPVTTTKRMGRKVKPKEK